MSNPSWPIVIVTGANGGVGFGICHRLLFQLCESDPSDAHPQAFASHVRDATIVSGCNGLTLIMACRSTKRAEIARTKLYSLLDGHIAKLRRKPGYDGHAEVFRHNVKIEIHYVDLALLHSVFEFADELAQRYPYVSHLICNAGLASFSGIYWPTCLKQLFTAPMDMITAPAYYLQHKGEISVDGLAWVWQCNLFGHYVLFRLIEPLLAASKSPLGSRVIWMSSLEASPKFYDSEDWQLRRTEHSYESTKYQIDLISTHLDCRALQENPTGTTRTRHFVTQPGVCSTNVSHALAGPILDVFKVIMFYIGRLCGSPHHTIVPFRAAVSAVHLSLASLAFTTVLAASCTLSESSKNESHPFRALKFGSETGRWGEERVGLTEVKEWEKHKGEAESLVAKCEELYQSFRDAEEATMDIETASERM